MKWKSNIDFTIKQECVFSYLFCGKYKLFRKLISAASLVFILSVSGYSQSNSSLFINSFISANKESGSFILSEAGKSAPLYIDSDDFPGVIRAAKDLQNDIYSVTSARPELAISEINKSDNIVIIGTLGKSKTIDKLVNDKKLDVESIKGKWEAYLIRVVKNPLPGISSALVIAGSDKRGTIYGIYEISSKIGVSPWYWWADVPAKKQFALYVSPGCNIIDMPSVKYRGFFINDEAPALMGWANKKFGGLNHVFYEKVFELLLRLKANYLWPAMWNNNFDDDDSLNQKMTDEYGIVMGTSHHEPMMRSWKEWGKYGHGDWNYQTNSDTLLEYWRGGIKRMDGYESIITLGMRGNGDEAMSESSNIGLLEKIIADQRKIIGEVTGKDVVTFPQMWALYKEVQEYYDKGMKIPDDVTLLMCDDNWGDLRKLPKPGSQPRSGGYGIYYHFDYVGGPRNYKWLNTNQIERTWEQMHLAYEYGVKQIWIVNVGDIKPLEFPISFFMDYAWNPDRIPADSLPVYYKLWAEQQFGSKFADSIAGILSKYTKFNARRKPELLSPATYSLNYYREAETVVKDYNNLYKEADGIYKKLPDEYKNAFYQLVLYPVASCANLNELYVEAAKNRMYSEQGRAATDSIAEKVKALFNKDADLSYYYNKVMADGKWEHMMDQTHIGYKYWQQPDSNNMPVVKNIIVPDTADMGVAIEGSEQWLPKDGTELTLPQFDPYKKQSYYIDIFNRGSRQFYYSINTGERYVKLSSLNGTVYKQKRIFVSLDWDKVPSGNTVVPVRITGPYNKSFTVNAAIFKPVTPARNSVDGFVENNGYLSINADHYSKAVISDSIKWQVIPNLGRTSRAVTAFPVISQTRVPGGESPHLEYNVYLFSKGEVNVKVYLSPTLKFNNKDLHYAVSFDNETPQIINMTTNPNPPNLDKDSVWSKWVSDNINIRVSSHAIAAPGEHTLKFWFVDPGVVLQKIVIDTGGLKPAYLGPAESYYRPIKKIK